MQHLSCKHKIKTQAKRANLKSTQILTFIKLYRHWINCCYLKLFKSRIYTIFIRATTKQIFWLTDRNHFTIQVSHIYIGDTQCQTKGMLKLKQSMGFCAFVSFPFVRNIFFIVYFGSSYKYSFRIPKIFACIWPGKVGRFVRKIFVYFA